MLSNENIFSYLMDFNLANSMENRNKIRINYKCLVLQQDFFALSLQYPLYRFQKVGKDFQLQPFIFKDVPRTLNKVKKSKQVLAKTATAFKNICILDPKTPLSTNIREVWDAYYKLNSLFSCSPFALESIGANFFKQNDMVWFKTHGVVTPYTLTMRAATLDHVGNNPYHMAALENYIEQNKAHDYLTSLG